MTSAFYPFAECYRQVQISATLLFAIRSSIIAVVSMSGFEVFLMMVAILHDEHEPRVLCP